MRKVRNLELEEAQRLVVGIPQHIDAALTRLQKLLQTLTGHLQALIPAQRCSNSCVEVEIFRRRHLLDGYALSASTRYHWRGRPSHLEVAYMDQLIGHRRQTIRKPVLANSFIASNSMNP